MVCLMLTGCPIIEDYRIPVVDIKDDWRVSDSSAAEYANLAWWENFADPVFNQLLEEMMRNNNDLHRATAVLREVASMHQFEVSEGYPKILAEGEAERSKESLERPRGAVELLGLERETNAYGLNLSMNWELDIWGRLARGNEAALADLLAVEEGRRAFIMTLVANLAADYINLLFRDRELVIARETQRDSKAVVEQFRRQLRGGQISELEFTQVRVFHEQISVHIPRLEQTIALIEHRLSLLLGRNPGPIERGRPLEQLPRLRVPGILPADLLTRRPDIRAKAQELLAANARVGVARAERYPRFSLLGILGYSADRSSNLLQDSASLYSLALRPVVPIYTGGRIDANIERFEARRAQSEYDYRTAVLIALKEVDDGLVSLQKLNELYGIEQRHLSVLADYVKYAHTRYENGFEPYVVVLDAKRNQFAARIEHAKTKRDIHTALIGLYKAVGGGWFEAAEKFYY